MQHYKFGTIVKMLRIVRETITKIWTIPHADRGYIVERHCVYMLLLLLMVVYGCVTTHCGDGAPDTHEIDRVATFSPCLIGVNCMCINTRVYAHNDI